MLSSTLCRDRDFILNIYVSHIRPKLEYGSLLWNLGYVGDAKLVESIQRRWTRTIAEVGHLTYEERLRELDLYSMYGRLLRADLIQVWKIFNGLSAISPEDLFELAYTRNTRGHSKKLQVQRCRLDTRKRSFAFRVVPLWNSLSSEAVEATTLSSFKSHIHRELNAELFKVFN